MIERKVLEDIDQQIGWHFEGLVGQEYPDAPNKMVYTYKNLEIAFKVLGGRRVMCTCTNNADEWLCCGVLEYDTPSATVVKVVYAFEFDIYHTLALKHTLGEVLTRMGYEELIYEP